MFLLLEYLNKKTGKRFTYCTAEARNLRIHTLHVL